MANGISKFKIYLIKIMAPNSNSLLYIILKIVYSAFIHIMQQSLCNNSGKMLNKFSISVTLLLVANANK